MSSGGVYDNINVEESNDIHDESKALPFSNVTEYVIGSFSGSVKLGTVYVPAVNSIAFIAGIVPP